MEIIDIFSGVQTSSIGGDTPMQYTYTDFMRAAVVRINETGAIAEVDFVDPDVPYLVIRTREGKKTIHASLVTPIA